MCIHDKYHINECQTFNILYFQSIVSISDGYDLDIVRKCTKHCQKKMAKIVDITMKQYSKYCMNYFKDAKPGKKSSFLDYLYYCLDFEKGEIACHDEDFVKDVEKSCNVKMENGKLYHTDPVDSDDSDESMDSEEESETETESTDD
ncbi:hypothetical protein DLAC_02224 [Tieghemostelium lacteum]|uniref:Uncharacterized protein n=1 Tax=Tieghemostelium lacteum TaxID=361077 RepID=A0A152A4W7_TIELA|nr:hypothetical protein DLAC_02224 [Tieghemostelium lacteum]|eukprot:KYR01121.1 hypothetical protein DLAC_02224 [Tieghemostelium lacteum]